MAQNGENKIATHIGELLERLDHAPNQLARTQIKSKIAQGIHELVENLERTTECYEKAHRIITEQSMNDRP